MAEYFRRDDGSLFEATDRVSVDTARGLGYTPLAAEQAKQSQADLDRYNQMRKDYGGFWGTVATTARHTIKTLLPGVEGLGDRLDEATFGKEFVQARKEERAVLDEVNPTAAGVGQALGIVGTAAIPVGTGAKGIALGMAQGAAAVKGGQYDVAVDEYMKTPKGLESTTQGFLEERVLKEGNWWALLGAVVGGIAPTIKTKYPTAKTFAREPLEENIPNLTRDQLAARGLDETAEAIILNKKLHNMASKAEVAESLKSVINAADGKMNAAKSYTEGTLLNPETWAPARKELFQMLKPQWGNEAVGKVLADLRRRPALSVWQLHRMRSELGKVVEKSVEAGTKEDVPIMVVNRAYDMMNDIIMDTLESKNPGAAELFRTAQKEQSAAFRLMKTFEPNPDNAIVKGIKGVIGYASGAAGYKAGGYMGGVAAAGAGKGALGATANTIPAMLEKGGDWLVKHEDAVIKAVNLTTKGSISATNVYQAHNMTPINMNVLQAQLSEVTSNPDKFTERVRGSLEEQGIKGPAADAVTMKLTEIATHLNDKMPKNTSLGSTITPDVQKFSKQQAQALSEHVEAAFRPSEALKNPTPRKVETLDRLYPETMSAVRYLVNNQVAEQGRLTRAQRDYASKILKTPATKMALPANLGILSGAVNAVQMQGTAPQPGAQAAQPKPFAPSSRNLEMTTSQRLAGGVNKE
jgi:hypothetical protein